MRIPAIEKAGFYPTHDAVVEVIKTYIQPAKPANPACWTPAAVKAGLHPSWALP